MGSQLDAAAAYGMQPSAAQGREDWPAILGRPWGVTGHMRWAQMGAFYIRPVPSASGGPWAPSGRWVYAGGCRGKRLMRMQGSSLAQLDRRPGCGLEPRGPRRRRVPVSSVWRRRCLTPHAVRHGPRGRRQGGLRGSAGLSPCTRRASRCRAAHGGAFLGGERLRRAQRPSTWYWICDCALARPRCYLGRIPDAELAVKPEAARRR